MKNKSIWVFILILQLSTSVQAQPTIDSSWYYPYSTSSFRNSANVYTTGSGGLGQIWDFSSATLFSLYNSDVNFSPNGYLWGGIVSDYEFHYFRPGVQVFEYYFEAKTSDSLVLNGINERNDPFGFAGNASQSIYTDPLLILKFPFTFQTMAVDSFVFNYEQFSWHFGTQNLIYSLCRGNRELIVDGFGDLILPDGLHSNSFRIKYVDTSIDTSWHTPSNYSDTLTKTSLTYSYWTTDNGILQKRYEIRKDSLINGLVPANPSFSAYYYLGISLVGISENNFKTNGGLVYPNPVHEYGTIKTPGVLLKKAKLEIYNSIAGLTQELSIVPTEVDRINFETQGLSSGYYKAVVRQDDKVWTAGFIKQ